MMQRGFVFSLSTILIFSFLVIFAAFYAGKVQREEAQTIAATAIEKAGFVADDIERDFADLLGTVVDANRSMQTMTITFEDSISASPAKLQLEGYKNFAQNILARQQQALISLDVSRLTDGRTEMLFSNGLHYDYDYSADQNSVRFYMPGADTQAQSFDANATIAGAILDTANSVPWLCPPEGTVLVKLHVQDGSGNLIDSACSHNPDSLRQYTIALQGQTGSITVSYGNIGLNPNSIEIKNTTAGPDAGIDTAIKTTIPSPAQETAWYYDADLNYSQSDTNINTKIMLGKT